ncbi:hypothetical protein [Parasutterella sp.]|jgi:hypothetical protein|uniref:hypothetical protein n=1 Tax=Parasutterella sp. TaxID=2049037 RepID=UPI003522909B
MNSVFNLASYNFNQLTDDELLTWLHSEGLANMPPIIRTLAERLEAVQQDVAYAQEETKDLKDEVKDYDRGVTEGLGQLEKELCGYASDLEKVTDTILESEGKILLPDGKLIDDLDLDEESPDDQIVVSRRQLDSIRAQIDSIGYAISNLETGDFFPARPSI